jgi:PhoPQ-activated pathogenicity-related protein
VRAQRFIVTGSSKGGMAALIACAGDARIVGAFPTAWNSGNVLEFTRLKGERWGWDVKPKQTGPAGETARESLEMLSSEHGRQYLRLFDPARWGELLDGTFVMPAVGANDHLFHLLSDQYYFDDLKCRKAFLRVPNYGHGREHPLHASAWRFAVAAALLDREIPSVRLTVAEEDGGIALYARIDNAAAPTRLVLWQAEDPTGDYRKAKWSRQRTVEVTGAKQSIRIAGVDPPDSGTSAYYLLMFNESPAGEAVTSSNVIELGTPVRHEPNSTATSAVP